MPASLDWVQPIIALIGVFVAIGASHARIISSVQGIAKRLDDVDGEMDALGGQLRSQALSVARLEAALGPGSVPLVVMHEQIEALKEELKELRKWRHEIAQQMQQAALDAVRDRAAIDRGATPRRRTRPGDEPS